MSESTIVALVILAGVFFTMIVTIIRSGPDEAIKMWGVMGALTGVAFGAITTYYFTDQVREREVSALRAEATRLERDLSQATLNASTATELVDPFANILRGEGAEQFPVSVRLAASLPEPERRALVERMMRTQGLLRQIENLEQVRVIESR